MEYINLVVGAGVSGATLARKLAEEKNQKIVVIDTKSHIGGNCYDYRDENGIMIHKYGSHIFIHQMKLCGHLSAVLPILTSICIKSLL